MLTHGIRADTRHQYWYLCIPNFQCFFFCFFPEICCNIQTSTFSVLTADGSKSTILSLFNYCTESDFENHSSSLSYMLWPPDATNATHLTFTQTYFYLSDAKTAGYSQMNHSQMALEQKSLINLLCYI